MTLSHFEGLRSEHLSRFAWETRTIFGSSLPPCLSGARAAECSYDSQR